MIYEHEKTISWILKTAVGTLAVITVLVIMILSVLLFYKIIDTQIILGILGPAVNTIIGAFVGLLGGLTLNGNGNNKENRVTDQETNETSN